MQPNFDLERARRETKHCEDIVHFNNAGSSLMPIPVSEALHAYLRKEERLGGYETAEAERDALESFYIATAQLLNCDADEIAFAENATRAWDMVFYSFSFAPGDKILTAVTEYGSNVIAYIQQAKRYGVEVVFVPNDEYGQLDVRAMEELIDERVKIISVSHIPTGGSVINPVKDIGQLANHYSIPFLLDSCQGIGQLPVDVKDIGCDAVCGTGRKYLRGPRGTGLLYVKRSLLESLEPPFLDQHAATLVSSTEYEIRPGAKRFENWEQYFAGKAALATAITYAQSFGLEAIRQRISNLSATLRSKLQALEGLTLTDEGKEKCGIVTFVTEQLPPTDTKMQLRKHQINVSASKGSGSFISFKERGINEVVRASVHYYNTAEEIDYFVETLRGILRRA